MKRSFRRHLMKGGRIRPTLRVILGLGLIALCVLALTTPVAFLLVLLSKWVQLREQTLFNISIVAQGLGIIVGVVIARHLLDHRSAAALGIEWTRDSRRDLARGFILGAGLQLLVFLTAAVFGWLTVRGPGPGALRPLSLLSSFLVLALVALYEELLSRGYIMQNLSEPFGMPAAVLISSIFFSAFHSFNSHVNWLAFINIALAGVLLSVGYLVTRSLYLPIGFHLAWNYFQGPVLGLPVSGFSGLPAILATQVEGPPLWTGGLFGPEAGLLGLFALLLGIVILGVQGNRTPRTRRF